MKTTTAALFLSLAATSTNVVAFQQPAACHRGNSNSVRLEASIDENNEISRRGLFTKTVSTAFTAASVAGILNSGGVVAPHSSLSSSLLQPEPASAIGPVKINLLNPTYTAIPCPKDRPIPGEKAMKGMRGLCVTVDVDLEDKPERPLDKIGVYGYITDKGTGESVLANNPDGGTDAGQFAMIEKIETSDQKVQFEFIAAVPSEMVRWRASPEKRNAHVMCTHTRTRTLSLSCCARPRRDKRIASRPVCAHIGSCIRSVDRSMFLFATLNQNAGKGPNPPPQSCVVGWSEIHALVWCYLFFVSSCLVSSVVSHHSCFSLFLVSFDLNPWQNNKCTQHSIHGSNATLFPRHQPQTNRFHHAPPPTVSRT